MKFTFKHIAGIAGTVGISALVLTGLELGGFLHLPEMIPLTPSQTALAGVLLTLLWLILTPGYKRLPFYVNLIAACLLFLAALWTGVLPVQPNEAVLLLAAAVFFLLCRYASLAPTLDPRRFGIYLPLLLLAGSAAAALTFPAGESAAALAYGGELDSVARVIARIDTRYRAIRGAHEEMEKFLEEELDDESSTPEKEAALVNELNERVARLTAELKRFAALEEENETYKGEIDRLKDRIGEIEYDQEYGEQTAKVATIAGAVRSSSPRVRDFAVKLAASNPGSFYRYSGGSSIPGPEGIRQIFAIHRYIAAEWSYVNDPVVTRDTESDYYSPADRTIALGLAGDCDDFAVLMAACIEAVGGRARILYGSCGDGAHAWCESYIGSEAVWREVVSLLFRHRNKSDLTYIRLPGGFVYLAAVIDLYSRKVLSWRLSNSLDPSFCVEALEEAIATFGELAIFNTDQGTQFTSDAFIAVLDAHTIDISMDGKGRALDNVYVERLWRSLKYEDIYLHSYETMPQLTEGVGRYFRFYNTKRFHQSLEYSTPEEMYQSFVRETPLPLAA
jgi:uncharacterized small protein (DUF1192 family)